MGEPTIKLTHKVYGDVIVNLCDQAEYEAKGFHVPGAKAPESKPAAKVEDPKPEGDPETEAPADPPAKPKGRAARGK